MGRGCYGGGQPAIYLFVRAAALCYVVLYVKRKKEAEREKKRKGRKGKEKNKKYEKLYKLENFWGEK
jgi:hypothetical protein